MPEPLLRPTMTYNDILRRLRYSFDYSDDKMMAIFALADHKVTREQLSNWLKKDDADDFQEIKDADLALFLNGLINHRRGKREGAQPPPEQRLNNNIIFRKLKIALDLQDNEILKIMDLTNMKLSRHELSAFFRKVGHKHYRQCKDQVMRNFIYGVQRKYRPDKPAPGDSPWTKK